ncbi:MAG: exo-beta-N-acetylmuramidase NamZ family protein [Thermodesulfobacteriota bacterium]
MTIVQTGLEHFIDSPPGWISGKRIGLLCNPASVDRRFRHARDLIAERFPGQLTALFAPQHGFFAEKQDNMVESEDTTDPHWNIPIFSLYGKTRVPTKKMFDAIDMLLVDIQDAGTRVYTFIYTLSYCLEVAREQGKTVVVLDRPNPLGGVAVEGNCLRSDCASFVGRYPIPMRHGLTIGEIAQLFNEHYGIQCDLSVFPMLGWKRSMLFPETGLPWVPPSPNLPTPASALVYPGQVLWEGTNVSEGRGTTQPFELFGAPFIRPERLVRELADEPLEGVVLRPVIFEPTSNKWSGKSCFGFQLHVVDSDAYRPYATSLKLLKATIRLHGDSFRWKSPPYEYEFNRWPIDLIIGDKDVRRRIEQGESIETMEKGWRQEVESFREISNRFQLY